MSYWYGLWRHGQIVQCVAAIQIQPGNQVESLQLTCPVCSLCEMWTILKSDKRKLETFHTSCQRRILGIHWFHHVTNAEMTSQTEQEDLTSHIRRRRVAVFGHVRQLPEEAPVNT